MLVFHFMSRSLGRRLIFGSQGMEAGTLPFDQDTRDWVPRSGKKYLIRPVRPKTRKKSTCGQSSFPISGITFLTGIFYWTRMHTGRSVRTHKHMCVYVCLIGTCNFVV